MKTDDETKPAESLLAFIEQSDASTLSQMFSTTVNFQNKPVHAFYYLNQVFGPKQLEPMIHKLSNNYYYTLMHALFSIGPEGNFLYKELMSDKTVNGKSLNQTIARILNCSPQLTYQDRIELIVKHYSQFDWEVTFQLMRALPVPQLLDLLLKFQMTNAEQSMMVEIIAKDNLENLLHIISELTQDEKYFLLTAQIPYGMMMKYSKDPLTNSAANTLSTALSRLPVIGMQLQHQIDAHQSLKEVTEPLLNRFSRIIPALQDRLPEVLNQLTGKQITSLFKDPDSSGKNLVFYLVKSHKISTLIQLFARAAYSVDNQSRVLSADHLYFDDYRIAVGAQREKIGMIGFIALLSIYHYLCVKMGESKDAKYETRKNDFCKLIEYISSRTMNLHIITDVKNHIENHSIYGSTGIPFVITSVRRQRYVTARDKLLELQTSELIEGLSIFKEFLIKRDQFNAEPVTSELNQDILKTAYVQSSQKEYTHK